MVLRRQPQSNTIRSLLSYSLLTLALASFSGSGYAQSLKEARQIAPFSDFHIYTSFKNYYRLVESPDSTIKIRMKN